MNKYNLIDILSKELEIEQPNQETIKYKFSGIHIPMIQRDYAQGRKQEGEIRKRILKSIFDALTGVKPIELDFVYGAINKLDGKNFFVPIDGQQRLTTLFLLHWYIGNRELNSEALDHLRSDLTGFSYATRATARKFCEKLSKISLSFQKQPSLEISNSTWFYDSFKKDPTIKAMLIMLDAIHKAYGDKPRSLFPNLSKLSFYILPLDGFELSDELYIKMNARGKQLTNYENFKADLINWLKDDNNLFKDFFHKKVNFNGRSIPYYLTLASKLDNNWTNLFWEHSKLNSSPEEKVVDPYLVRFWNRYLLNYFVTTTTLAQDSIEKHKDFQLLYGPGGNESLFKYESFDLYKTIFEQTNIIPQIEQTLDVLTDNYDLIRKSVNPIWDKDDNWSIFNKSINQRQRVLFFAITQYLERNEFDSINFKRWIRVVWNIIVDPNLRSVPAMVTAMKLVAELAKGSDRIYEYLLSAEVDSLLENNKQLKEERTKAHLITQGSEWEDEILLAESHPMFKGNIKFLLTESITLDTFSKNRKIAFTIFSKSSKVLGTPNSYLWLRCALAKNKNISLPMNLSDGQFDNWRNLINSTLITGIREVIHQCASSNLSLDEVCQKIITDYELSNDHQWLYHIIKWQDPAGKCLLDYSSTATIKNYKGYDGESEQVYLFNKTIWTEGNIILSNFRNELIKELMITSSLVKHNDSWGNIHNTYFRGWDVTLTREVKDLPFQYFINRTHVKVGVKNSVNPELVKDFVISDTDKEDGWVFRKKFKYAELTSLSDIIALARRIEDDVFNEGNSNSLINNL